MSLQNGHTWIVVVLLLQTCDLTNTFFYEKELSFLSGYGEQMVQIWYSFYTHLTVILKSINASPTRVFHIIF